MKGTILIVIIAVFANGHILAETPICSTRENEMIKEINYARTKPAEYAKYIDEFLDEWESIKGMTEECNKLKKIMLTMQPLEPLQFSPKLYELSTKHGVWMKQTGRFDHSSFNLSYGENLCAGSKSVRMAVIDLLIDYGVPSYGHRLNLFDPEYKFVAVREVPGLVGDDDYVFIQQFAYNETGKY